MESKEHTQEEYLRWKSNFQNSFCTSNTPVPQITIIGSIHKQNFDDDLNPEYGMGISSKQETQRLNSLSTVEGAALDT